MGDGYVVLVCGGRAYADRDKVFAALDELQPSRIVHGGARGADGIAADWARRNGVRVREYKADWERLGRAAGPQRNAHMLSDARPDIVLAFPGGRGTADMVRRARAAGVEVREVHE